MAVMREPESVPEPASRFAESQSTESGADRLVSAAVFCSVGTGFWFIDPGQNQQSESSSRTFCVSTPIAARERLWARCWSICGSRLHPSESWCCYSMRLTSRWRGTAFCRAPRGV